jgi:hypothetical protein
VRERERERERKRLRFIKAENLPSLGKEMNIQIQAVQKTPK